MCLNEPNSTVCPSLDSNLAEIGAGFLAVNQTTLGWFS